MQTILTSETHTIYTLDSDLSYSKLLALWKLSNPSYSALVLEKNHSSTGLHCSDPSHACKGEHPRCTDNVRGHGLLLCVHEMCGLVYTVS